jgi:hypothetical protein
MRFLSSVLVQIFYRLATQEQLITRRTMQAYEILKQNDYKLEMPPAVTYNLGEIFQQLDVYF